MRFPAGAKPPPPTARSDDPASVPGITYHNWISGVTPTGSIAHRGGIADAKALAATIPDFKNEPQVPKAAHEQWEQVTKQTPYFSRLPPDAKDDLALNRDTMAKYRPAMEKFYLHKTPRYQ